MPEKMIKEIYTAVHLFEPFSDKDTTDEKKVVEINEVEMFCIDKEESKEFRVKREQQREEEQMEQDAKEAEKIMSQKATPERIARIIEITNRYKLAPLPNSNTRENRTFKRG
jgi:hypothetical protein